MLGVTPSHIKVSLVSGLTPTQPPHLGTSSIFLVLSLFWCHFWDPSCRWLWSRFFIRRRYRRRGSGESGQRSTRTRRNQFLPDTRHITNRDLSPSLASNQEAGGRKRRRDGAGRSCRRPIHLCRQEGRSSGSLHPWIRRGLQNGSRGLRRHRQHFHHHAGARKATGGRGNRRACQTWHYGVARALDGRPETRRNCCATWCNVDYAFV